MVIYKMAMVVRVALPQDVAQPSVNFFLVDVGFNAKSYGGV